MKITVLRKMEYERHQIYIMQFGKIFQYLFADKSGSIYQHYISVPANPFRLLKYHLGLAQTPFSMDEIEVGERIVLSGAMTSIDALITKEKIKTRELKEVSQVVNKLKKNPDCMWRAIEIDKVMKYQCLAHDMIVDIVDGQVPVHELTGKVLSPLQYAQD